MPYKEKPITKLYRSIGEVAAELGVNASLIRYWEKEFKTVRPKRTGKGDRLYTEKDIAELKRIHRLVKEEGFTLQGAREKLRSQVPDEAAMERTLRRRLLVIREKLMALSKASGTDSNA